MHRFFPRMSTILLAVWLLLPCMGARGAQAEPSRSETFPQWDASDPSAPAVTLENLYQSERFWPYQILLTRPWKPEGHQGEFGWGMGVLIRVARSGALRVDFARFGKHWVPADATDVVERANRVRLGEDRKFGPNLVVAIQQRVMDPREDGFAAVHHVELMEMERFLLVFADPRAEGFEAIARSLDFVQAEHPGTLVVLLPQGEMTDEDVRQRLRSVGWPGGFLLGGFTPAYTQGFLAEGQEPPWLQLTTPEGRVIFEGSPDRALARQLKAAIVKGAVTTSRP